MTPEEIAHMHSDLILADLDQAAEGLVEALEAMVETGADNRPPQARTPLQEAAAVSKESAVDELYIQLASLLNDRYGLNVRFDIDTVSL